jgi:hypothetical protein
LITSWLEVPIGGIEDNVWAFGAKTHAQR